MTDAARKREKSIGHEVQIPTAFELWRRIETLEALVRLLEQRLERVERNPSVIRIGGEP